MVFKIDQGKHEGGGEAPDKNGPEDVHHLDALFPRCGALEKELSQKEERGMFWFDN